MPLAAAIDPPPPIARDLAAQWMLDPGIDFLNHGSFGALPREIARAQDRWRARIEAEPIELLGRGCRALLAEARVPLAEFVGARPDDLGFVVNATEGINAVLRSLELRAGDELLTTDHVYNAVRQAMRQVARRAGASVVEVPIPVPLADEAAIVDAIVARVTDRTRLVVVDHVTSPTAIRFPVERIAAVLRARGVDLLVDGAHAPGMLPLRIESLGVDYYSANLHKWVCAPKGCAFLWARPERQRGLHPTTVSHFLDEGFEREFAWQGTRDITPWLCAPEAIRFMGALDVDRGWPGLMEHNHRLAVWVQATLCRMWGVQPLTPLDGTMLGSMATVPLPEPLRPAGGRIIDVEALQELIYRRHRIEVPLVPWGGRLFVRPCCQVYNRPEQYRRLGEVLLELAADADRHPDRYPPAPCPT